MRGTQRQSRHIRFLIAALLAFSLIITAGCIEKPAAPTETTASTTQAAVPSEADASLVSLRQALVETPQLFAVAYFGCHYNIDSDLPVDPIAVMKEQAPGLCQDLPFLLEIPKERIIGEYGDLFCIVPLDVRAQVAVSLGAWDESNEEYIYEESLCLSESGEPILLFCNHAGWEPDTQLQISGPSGTVTWYPQIDDNLCPMPLIDDNLDLLFFDFSPYRELLAADYRNMKENIEWEGVLPTGDMLVGSTWVWYGCLKDGREVSYRVTFDEAVLSVFWNDGIDIMDQEYLYAPWELTYEEGFAVLSIDFEGFAGVHRYNLMYSEFYGDLYVGMDVLQDEMPIGWEPLYRYMTQPVTPDPIEMAGTWELAWTEVEGDRNEAAPGLQIIDIKTDYEGLYWISYQNNLDPAWNYHNKELVVFPFALYYGCGNNEWSATVNYTGINDTGYAVTLLDYQTLLVQSSWEMDGAPMVGYEWYRRVE